MTGAGGREGAAPDTPDEVFSVEDLFLTAAALRHERAQRIWVAKTRGHHPKALGQLKRLEETFDALGRARVAARQAAADERAARAFREETSP